MKSRETQRKQKIPGGNLPKERRVQPRETSKGLSVAPARINTHPCEEGEYQLLEKILTKDNLKRALERVEKNEGAPGIDGMKTCELREYLKNEWPHIKASLLDGTYRPLPVRRVEILKPDGGTRLLGIPTVPDRMIQQATAQILTPIFEKEFSEHSHGFRPGRKAHDAVENAQQYIRNRGKSVQAVIEELNAYLQGSLLSYYALADMKGFLTELEGWIRRKLRVISWKHWKRTKTRFKELRKLGSPIEATKKIVSSRKGYWRLAKTPQLHRVMGTAYFKSLGLVSLVDRYSLIRQG